MFCASRDFFPRLHETQIFGGVADIRVKPLSRLLCTMIELRSKLDRLLRKTGEFNERIESLLVYVAEFKQIDRIVDNINVAILVRVEFFSHNSVCVFLINIQ